MRSASPAARDSTALAAGQAEARRFRVAVVDEELPYPLNSGKRIRTFNLLRRLAERHEITFLCHGNADPAETRVAAAALGEAGIKAVIVGRAAPPRSVTRQGPRFYAGLAANLLSPRPYLVDVNNSPELRRAVLAHAATASVDLWQCEWTPIVEVLRPLAGARVLVVAHNIESRIWERYHQTERNPAKRWYIARQLKKFERFERCAFSEAAHVVLVSDVDATLARERFSAGSQSVVENGVDTEYFRPTGAAREANRILFLGSLDWRPNLDAVRLLLDQIFPAVLALEPSARLSLVGRNPPAWLADRARVADGVELVADAPDVRPHLARSGVMAVPLRIGGGSRLKILEALASGLPVVSTRVGAEGLCLQPDRDLVVASEPNMARALVDCIRDPASARAMADQGRRVVLDRYDWDTLAGKLERAWTHCLGGGGEESAG